MTDPRGFPTTLPEFQQVFPDDTACTKYLEQLKWPNGFVCQKCGTAGEPFRFVNKPWHYRCRFCRVGTSITAGTVMHSTHTPLSTWFWAAYLVTTQTPGQSALQFQRQLGLSRYETAYQILHKLRSGMVRPDRDCIGGEHEVEVDETLVGGRTRGEGRGVHHKLYVIGAVEVRERKDGEDRSSTRSDAHKDGVPLKKSIYAGRLRLQVIKDRKATTCEHFIMDNVRPDTRIKTDGWTGYDNLGELGWPHHGLVMNADPELAAAHLPMIHLVFSNLKAWILGTHHGNISQQHLQAYLNEYTFRFNRRFHPMTAFNSVLGLAAHAVPPTYKSLYSGEWQHPTSVGLF